MVHAILGVQAKRLSSVRADSQYRMDQIIIMTWGG